MEGDAGASQLNPIDADDSLSSDTPVTESAEDSQESEGSAASADQSSAQEKAEDSTESEAVVRGPSRLGGAWLVGISVVLIFLAGAVGAGGYYALHTHREMQTLSNNDAAALKVAKECVAATQAPDTNSMAASEQKIIDCGTDQYRTQALLYSSMLVQAYQAANVHLKVSDLRAAVERNNPDGTVDILVALRVNVSNDQQQNQETGYRLRVKMTPTDGTYKISKLDQVTK